MFLSRSNAAKFGSAGSAIDGKLTWKLANSAGRASSARRFNDGACRLIDGRPTLIAQALQSKLGIDGSVMPLSVKVRSGMLGNVGSENSDAKLGMPKLMVGSVKSKLSAGSVTSNRSNNPNVAVKPTPKLLPVKLSDWLEPGITSPALPSSPPDAFRLFW